jgi:hypothetical protein
MSRLNHEQPPHPQPVTVSADDVWEGDEVLETWSTPDGVRLARIRPTQAHTAQIRADFIALFGEPVQLIYPVTPVRDAPRRRRP